MTALTQHAGRLLLFGAGFTLGAYATFRALDPGVPR